MEGVLRVFVRQPFTQSGQEEQAVIQGGMNILSQLKDSFKLKMLTSLEAQNAASFKSSFEENQGREFTPSNFRKWRLGLIDQADAFIVLRTGLSESGAFEVAYNIFSDRKTPIFFAVWKKAPIKTTLLQGLEELCEVTYCEFDSPEELKQPFTNFFSRLMEE